MQLRVISTDIEMQKLRHACTRTTRRPLHSQVSRTIRERKSYKTLRNLPQNDY